MEYMSNSISYIYGNAIPMLDVPTSIMKDCRSDQTIKLQYNTIQNARYIQDREYGSDKSRSYSGLLSLPYSQTLSSRVSCLLLVFWKDSDMLWGFCQRVVFSNHAATFVEMLFATGSSMPWIGYFLKIWQIMFDCLTSTSILMSWSFNFVVYW